VFQESEIVDLVLAVGLAPLMYASVRRLEIPGKVAFLTGFLFMVASYIFTIAESVVLPEALNVAEHASLAAAGIAFAVGVWQLRSSLVRSGEAL
jgi:hypothetical protein